VVTGVPTKAYRLPTEWIPPNTVVVNVASFKNVDEESLLKVPGVVYVPQVGKVTVAMLERNLMRLFEQFHHPDKFYKHIRELHPQQSEAVLAPAPPQPWYGHPLNLYTAAVVSVLAAMEVFRKRKS
jgi:methylenetetrahydrofolate dehydrogenase (NAD+)